MAETKTTNEDLDIKDEELNDLLAVGGAANVMTSKDEKKDEKSSKFFERGPSTNFVDNHLSDEQKEKAEKERKANEEKEKKDKGEGGQGGEGAAAKTDVDLDKAKKELENKGDEPAQIVPIKGLAELFEKGILKPFEDKEKAEEYTPEELVSLVKTNLESLKPALREEVATEFFESLPEDFQYATAYVAQGGKDMKSLYKALAAVEEVKELDPTIEADQEKIVWKFLHSKQFGTEEQIQEEITSIKDRKELDKKAAQFKPLLDAMQEQDVKRQIANQEKLAKQRKEASEQYTKSVYEVLKDGELNGIKLDDKVRDMLYFGLVNSQYPSVSGKTTNLLGHYLEQAQFVKPNHSLIAEVLWHLADPDGFKAKLKEQGSTEASTEVARKLKGEAGKKKPESVLPEGNESGQVKKKGLARPNANFFKRT